MVQDGCLCSWRTGKAFRHQLKGHCHSLQSHRFSKLLHRIHQSVWLDFTVLIRLLCSLCVICYCCLLNGSQIWNMRFTFARTNSNTVLTVKLNLRQSAQNLYTCTVYNVFLFYQQKDVSFCSANFWSRHSGQTEQMGNGPLCKVHCSFGKKQESSDIPKGETSLSSPLGVSDDSLVSGRGSSIIYEHWSLQLAARLWASIFYPSLQPFYGRRVLISAKSGTCDPVQDVPGSASW